MAAAPQRRRTRTIATSISFAGQVHGNRPLQTGVGDAGMSPVVRGRRLRGGHEDQRTCGVLHAVLDDLRDQGAGERTASMIAQHEQLGAAGGLQQGLRGVTALHP